MSALYKSANNLKSAFFECAVIACGIYSVTAIVFGEIVIARKIRFGTHVEVVVSRSIEHGIKLATFYHSDRARGDPDVNKYCRATLFSDGCQVRAAMKNRRQRIQLWDLLEVAYLC